MGAIVAIVGDQGDPELELRIDRMLNRSPYRGTPQRTVHDGVAVGVQVIDTDASLARTKTITVAFHGFVGNWVEVAVANGLDLSRETTDAQRLAILWQATGNAIFGSIRGEYSAIVFSPALRSIAIARDAIGLRPLFFEYSGDRRLYIGTEIRQVLAGSGGSPNPDEPMIALELLSSRLPPNRTFYRGVERFIPGAVQHVRNRGSRRPGEPTRHWIPPQEPQYCDINQQDLADDLRSRLVTAIRRTIPACPEKYALALSGGVDSSAIWGLIHNDLAEEGLDPLRCEAFSLVFPEEPHDESDYINANLAAFGRTGYLLDGARQPVTTGVERIPSHPNGVFRCGMLHIDLSHRAYVRNGIRIELNGLGGDEWFRGDLRYMSHLAFHGHPLIALRDSIEYFAAGRLKHIYWSQLVRPELGRIARRLGIKRQNRLPSLVHRRLQGETLLLRRSCDLAFPAETKNPSNPSLAPMVRTYVGGSYTDPIEQAAATYGISHRHPFLDRDLIDFAFSTHGRWHIEGGEIKHLLRRAVHSSTPPVVNRRMSKTQFDGSRYAEGDRVAREEKPETWEIVRREIVDIQYVDKLIAGATMRNTAATKQLAKIFDCEFFVRRACQRE